MDTSKRRRRRLTTFRRAGWLAVAALTTMALFANPGLALGHAVSVGCSGVIYNDPSPSFGAANVFATGTTSPIVAYLPASTATVVGSAAVPAGTYDVKWIADSYLQTGIIVSSASCTTRTTTLTTTTTKTSTITSPVTTTQTYTTTTPVTTTETFSTTTPVTTTETFSTTTPVTTTETFSTTTPVTTTETYSTTETQTLPVTTTETFSTTTPVTTTQTTATTQTSGIIITQTVPVTITQTVPVTTTLTAAVEATSTSRTGAVAGATGKPHITPPPTSTFGAPSGAPSDSTWRIGLLALAGLLASLLLLTPSRVRDRQR